MSASNLRSTKDEDKRREKEEVIGRRERERERGRFVPTTWLLLFTVLLVVVDGKIDRSIGR